MARSLRVVAYTDSAGVGGAEISLGHLVAAIADGEVAVDIDVTVVGVAEEVTARVAAQHPRIKQVLLPARGSWALPAHFTTFQHLQPDIVHVNLCTPWAGAIGLMAALALPKVRVVRVDQLPLRTTDAIELWRTRMLCLRVDAHVAVGAFGARRMEDFYALGRDTVHSIPNGVPDVVVEPGQVIQVNHPSQMVVGCVGRLDPMKAQDVLLQAIAQVEGVRLMILGEGEFRSTLEQLINELGIRDRVDLLGWVEQPQIYLPAFDVVALPSRSEGFPLAIVEAMLASRPVVATRVGSVPEALQDGVTGILVEKNDVDGLTTALRRLRDDPCLRQQMGAAGRERAIAHFTADQMAKQYLHLWQQVLASPQASRLWVDRPKD